jgi:hypothetical protein
MEQRQQKPADQPANLYLIDSIRTKAEEIAAKEGGTLNEFVNVAVAEKLAHYQHMEWVKNRKPVTEEGLLEARRILRRAGSGPPDPGDELPEGWPPLEEL